MNKDETRKVRLSGTSGWTDLPLTERNPAMTCSNCFYASKERAYPGDLMGMVFCRHGPKHLTSFPQPNGTVVGHAGNPAIDPLNWCGQFWPRSAGDPQMLNEAQRAEAYAKFMLELATLGLPAPEGPLTLS